eukprot:NODE_1920_length_1034_cov_115.665990_g1562_i0.p1 GENE.NODE_1920_length_1034_cov_115.665990_g1562_i0~~NODE_1920_length_1034_cov_115.665990_g1562_i0.p1  ORF type:complete len:298 (-),score=92.41 NODE_1920_length_1034_cov_115.665990_g1562_i0:139-990(-)
MDKENWEVFKAAYLPGNESDPFFDELAEIQESSHPSKGREARPTVSFEGFLRLVFLVLGKDLQHDPVTIMNELRQILQAHAKAAVKAPSAEEEEMISFRALIKLIQRRTTRMLDIYCGPVLCGTVMERSGYITTFKPNQLTGKHRFLTYTQHDLNMETRIVDHLVMAESFDHLLHRLLSDGMDLAVSCDPRTRKPTGRCWKVAHGGDGIGALWDYTGQYSNLDWQPAQVESTNDAMTMTVYRNDDDIHYVSCFACFTKAKSISQMRQMLATKGYSLSTQLYKL